MKNDSIKVGLCQISSEWLNREKTIKKVTDYVSKAISDSCDLVIFGEGLIPGYPFWIEHTEGAKFESDFQKDLFAHYLKQAVVPERGDLDPICKLSKQSGISVIVGTIEAAQDRGGHSVYCSLILIQKGNIVNVHRKLMPTYEERLVWAQGDGHGLNTYPQGPFTLGALNCWENWMPLARTALYSQGEDLHVAIWPGNVRNTVDITRWIAKESRSYVISVSSLFSNSNIPDELIHSDVLKERMTGTMANGGSCICDPKGNWLIEPIEGIEGLFTTDIYHEMVRKERQNFDPTGHYSRPDVLKVQVNKSRQQGLEIL